jgi:phosphohistidine phosphatase SixA
MARVFLFLVLAIVSIAARADDAMWALLKAGGQVVLIRHATTTPGVGDPPGFKLGECPTQRNLSDEGRREAVALGDAWRARGITPASLVSSPWCRCLETARLAFRQDAKPEPALANLFGRHEREAAQVAQLKKLVARQQAPGNAVMVTHGSTIYALTGVSPAQGEMVIVTPQPGAAGFKVAGRLTVTAAAPGTPTSGRP